jgi:hypothetical protein
LLRIVYRRMDFRARETMGRLHHPKCCNPLPLHCPFAL